MLLFYQMWKRAGKLGNAVHKAAIQQGHCNNALEEHTFHLFNLTRDTQSPPARICTSCQKPRSMHKYITNAPMSHDPRGGDTES